LFLSFFDIFPQLLAGAIIFVFGGLLILILFVGRRFTHRHTDVSSYLTGTGVIGLLVGGYGASVVWLLRSYMRTLLLKHWEFVFLYIGISGFTGVMFVAFMRRHEETKHFLRISAKWVLRLIGIVLVFNGSASPLVSTVYVLAVAFAYIIAYIRKALLENSSKKRKMM
jgi:NEMP family